LTWLSVEWSLSAARCGCFKEKTMIKVHHANKATFRDSVWYGYSMGLSMVEIIVKFQNGEYNEAGQLETDNLDQAYHDSQNLVSAWGDGKQRSTSVGDILETDDGVYIVAKEGFDKIMMKEAA
jgi:hypothetical protein